jgi:hypothetical protein
MSAVLEKLRPAAETETTSSLLHDIISRVDAIGVAQQRPSPVRLKTWEEIERFAEKAARSGMVPKDYIGKPDAICIAVQMGSELGLAPMQALQNIAVINGRPSVWGDAVIGLCRASDKCRGIREWSEGSGETLTYYCEARRSDDPKPIVGKFSVAEAKQASLWGKAIWQQYPQRMLQMRARGFALRDAFPDVLKGLISGEEAQDIPFETTGLTPTQPAAEPTQRDKQAAGTYSAREQINRDVPLEKKTWAQWAESIEIAARDAGNNELGRMLAEAQMTEIVRLAGMGQPSPAKARIIAAYRTIEERYLADPPDPAGESAPDQQADAAWPGEELVSKVTEDA